MDNNSLYIKSIITLVFFLIMSSGLIYLAWKAANKFYKDERLGKNKLFLILRILVFVYFVSFLIYRTANSHLDPTNLHYDSTLAEFFSGPLKLEDAMSFMFKVGLGLVNYLISEDISLFLGVYFPGLILIFLGIYSLWIVIKNKKILFLRLGIFLYVVSLFFINPEAYTRKLEFQLDTLNLSQLIEKNEATIFYRPMKFFNHDEGKFFQYAVEFKEGIFRIQNNTGKNFYLDPKDLDSNFIEKDFSSVIHKIDYSAYDETLRTESKIKWPSEFRCENEIPGYESTPDNLKEGIPVVHVENSNSCQKLFYQGKLVLKNSNMLDLSDFDISDDKKWAMFVTYGGYDPENLYLVHLAK